MLAIGNLLKVCGGDIVTRWCQSANVEMNESESSRVWESALPSARIRFTIREMN
jgi:hypothetical protein